MRWTPALSCLLLLSLTSPAARMEAMDRRGGEPSTQGPETTPLAVGTLRPSPLQLAELTRANVGDEVVVRDWDLGERPVPLVLRRIDVYDPEARIYAVTPSGLVEVPRSPRRHFVGEATDGSGVRMMLSLDPTARDLRGMAVAGGRVLEVLPAASGARDAYDLVPAEELLAAAGQAAGWSCGLDETGDGGPEYVLPDEHGTSAKALPSLHGATIAVDTDNEFMLSKFSNNTSAASDYIADLIAGMNVMYERDLNVRLLQGTTYLRVSTQTDPYTVVSDGAANSAQLNEFGSYWQSHYSSVGRALAMMLSGKSPSSYSASGIAWVSGLCSTSYGYSFSQVFKINYLAGDVSLVGHELGHNFGSHHTHCYNPPIDTCYSGECYVGATSCPAAGYGTIMSYCHLLGGCGAHLLFHPRVIAVIDSRTSVASCIEPLVPVDTVPPSISDATADPRITTPGHSIVLSATIVDALSGVDSAEARVRDGGGTLRATVALSDAGGGVWSGALGTGGLALGTYTVDIAAEDASPDRNEATAVAAASFELRSTFACGLDLSDETVSGSESWEVCGIVTAAPDFLVTGSGSAAVTAGYRIVVRNGFTVQSGGTLQLGVDPLLQQ